MGRALERLGKEELIAAIRALERRLRDDRDLQRVAHERDVHQEELRAQQRQLTEMQEQLEASRDRYADLFDFAPIGYLVFDANGLVTDVNLKAAALLGVERGRLIELPLIVYVIPDDRPALLKHLHWCRRGDPLVRTELRLRRSGAEPVPVELMSRPWHPRDREQTLFHTAVLDLRERQEAEEERQANQAKNRFLAMLSHELRTPLTPIFFELNALARLPLAAEVREALDVIGRNARIEANLIDDLLDVTRIAHGKLRLAKHPVDVQALLAETVADCEDAAGSAGIDLQATLQAEESWVAGDAVRLRQVFLNLIQNAIRSTPAGGRITVRAASGAGRLHVEVEDTGVGFDPAAATRLFDAFDQGGNGEGRRGSLGLGLTICKALVGSHGGIIRGFSRGPGTGACFTAQLPLTDERPETIEPPQAQNTPPRPLRILLVEDHADTASALAELLGMGGHEVAIAGTAAEALARGTDDVDVVVSDLGLPDASGCDLVRELRQRSAVPAIALSGYGASEDVERSLAAGFQRHLTKPVDGAAIMAALRDVTTGGKALLPPS